MQEIVIQAKQIRENDQIVIGSDEPSYYPVTHVHKSDNEIIIEFDNGATWGYSPDTLVSVTRHTHYSVTR